MTATSNMPHAAGTQAAPVKASMPKPSAARTELGRKLRELRRRIVASGQPLLDENELNREIRERRGVEQAEG